MAIQKSTETDQGFTCPDAYYVIESVMYNKNDNITTGNVGVYKDLASRDAGKPVIHRTNVRITYDLDSPDNVIEQLYIKLKETLVDGVDV